MTWLALCDRLFWTLSSFGAAFALFRAFQLGLVRRYPAFVLFLVAILFQYVSLVWIDVATETYRTAWMWYEPLIGVGIAAIAIEAWIRFSRTVSTDPQFWTMLGSGVMAIGLIASLLSSQLDRTLWDGALQFAIWSRRYLASTFGVALCAAAILGRVFGVPLAGPRGHNIGVHLAVVILYLLATSAGFIGINALAGKYTALINACMSGIFTVAFVWWALAMQAEGHNPSSRSAAAS